MTLPQSIAAEKLGVSISTLKRRYYELEWGRWPSNSSSQSDLNESESESDGEKSMDSSSSDTSSQSTEDKADLSFVLNDNEVSPKELDPTSLKVLQCAFKQQFIE